MPKIKTITARKILNSRGDWTVEAEIVLEGGVAARASVPQGKSVGLHEAAVISAERAVEQIEKKLSFELVGHDFPTQRVFDDYLIELDGTIDKSRFGANTLLALSTVFARASARCAGMPLWQHLRLEFGLRNKINGLPRLFINVINGGLHAANNLNFQEYLVIPRAARVSEAVDVGRRVYENLRSYLLANFNERDTNVGDEGGFAPNFTDELEPFVILGRVARQLNLKDELDFGCDVAAGNVKYAPHELLDIYRHLRQAFNLIYLEDPFAEDRPNDFAGLLKVFGDDLLIAGDDLTATNAARMNVARRARAINSVIIKPNQIGTVTEAWDAAMLAKGWGWKIIASHRSGETNDDFIADFAVATESFGLKLGAPARGERVAKYNRLLEIEKEI